MLRDLPPEEFRSRVLADGGAKLVLFHARWCGYCARFAPQFERWASESELSFFRVDLSDGTCPLWDSQQINVVPTLAAYVSGREVFRAVGMLGLEQLAQAEEELENVLRQ